MVLSIISLPERQFWQWASAQISMASRLKSNLNLTSRKKLHNVKYIRNFEEKLGDFWHYIFAKKVLTIGISPYFYGFLVEKEDHVL